MRQALRVRPQATADIDHAAAYLLEANPAAAAAFLDALEAAFGLLAEQPGIGSSRYAHILPGATLRMWPLKDLPYLVFYLVRADGLEVVRVLHGARDLPAILTDAS